jgi:hypothetical protein
LQILSITNKELKRINECRNLDEPTKKLAILNVIEKSMPMMQLSRITGIYYSKIQKMKKGQEGKVIGITHYKQMCLKYLTPLFQDCNINYSLV